MAKTEVYTCDRCKVVLEQDTRFAVTVFQSRYPRGEYDLCAKCYCELKDWLEGAFIREGLQLWRIRD